MKTDVTAWASDKIPCNVILGEKFDAMNNDYLKKKIITKIKGYQKKLSDLSKMDYKIRGYYLKLVLEDTNEKIKYCNYDEKTGLIIESYILNVIRALYKQELRKIEIEKIILK